MDVEEGASKSGDFGKTLEVGDGNVALAHASVLGHDFGQFLKLIN